MASIQPMAGRRWRAQVCVKRKRSSKVFSTERAAQTWADQLEAKQKGMPALRAALEDHRILELLPLKFRDAVQRANYTEAELLASAFSVEFDSGIYFLIRQGAIYYVGQTTSILQRILKHRRNGRKFDAFAFIPCEPEHLDELERIYITLLLPEANAKGI